MDIKDLLKLISRISFTGPGGIERITKVLKELVEKLNTVVTEDEIENILSSYYTQEEVQSILEGYVSNTQIQSYYTKEQVDLIIAALGKNSYRVAWDGSTQPVVANIPAGIVVTYNDTDYTGTLPASTGTINSIYLVGQDMYVTSKDGDIYSWVFAGTTELDLNDYATKAEFSQLQAKVGDFDMSNIPLTGNWAIGTFTSSGSYADDSRRLICSIDLTGKVGCLFHAAAQTGYDIAVRFMTDPYEPDAHNISGQTAIYESGWVDSLEMEIPTGTQSLVVVARKDTNADIPPSDAANISLSYDGYITLVERVEKVATDVANMNTRQDISLTGLNWTIGTLSGEGNFAEDSRRLLCSIDISGLGGFTFSATPHNGYDIYVHFLSSSYESDPSAISNAAFLYSEGWISAFNMKAPTGVRSIVLLLRHNDNSDVSLNDAQEVDVTLSLTKVNERVTFLDNLIPTAKGMISGNYFGAPLTLGQTKRKFKIEPFATFAIARFAQSLSIYGDYIVFFYGGGGHEGSIWRISDGTKMGDIDFPDTINDPHGNVLSFGVEFAPGNTDLPLLYLSETFNGGRCYVYDLHIDGSIQQVQTIAGNIVSDIFGAQGDWVVDKDSLSLFSIRYRLDSYTVEQGNCINICRFRLPKLGDGTNIILTDGDILDFYISPFVPYMQDKSIYGGVLYIGSGNENAGVKQQILAISTSDGHMVANIDLHNYNNEPEGLEVIEDGLVLGYGYDYTQYYLLTT